MEESSNIAVIRQACELPDKNVSAEILAEMLTDPSWTIYGVCEEMFEDYLSGSYEFRKGMDNALTALTGWTLSTIASKVVGRRAII